MMGEAVEQEPADSCSVPVEAESEFVEVVVEMLVLETPPWSVPMIPDKGFFRQWFRADSGAEG